MGLEIDHSWAGNCVFPDLQLELGRDLGKSVDLSTGFAPGCMLDFRRLRAMSRIRESGDETWTGCSVCSLFRVKSGGSRTICENGGCLRREFVKDRCCRAVLDNVESLFEGLSRLLAELVFGEGEQE